VIQDNGSASTCRAVLLFCYVTNLIAHVKIHVKKSGKIFGGMKRMLLFCR